MIYAALSLCFIGAALVLGLGLTLLRRPRPHLAAVAVTVIALVVLTAVFDNVMIAAGLFHYAPAHLLGIRVGLAPIEDFAYPIAGALLLPMIWAVLRGRHRSRRQADPARDGLS